MAIILLSILGFCGGILILFVIIEILVTFILLTRRRREPKIRFTTKLTYDDK